MKQRSVEECRLIDLPKISNNSGNLTFMESGRHLPYDFRRVYYIYDIPGGAMRGSHAHKECHEFLIAISGSFDVTLDDGSTTKKFHLNRSHIGLYVCPAMWRDLDNFSSGAICLVFSSDYYDEKDYWRNYDDFINAVRHGRG
jgi:dTDP-4-dehydrorhamnose 3,5-epimerase-like enzyme